MVSVIICSRNRPAMVMDALRSVLDGTLIPAEVIIVDQSDSDHPDIPSLGWSESRVRYLRQGGKGVSRARNAGANAASNEILVFIDDDVLVAPNWLHNLIAALDAAPLRTVVSGSVREMDAGVDGGFAPSIRISDVPVTYQERGFADVLFTGNMAIHRQTLEAAGGFDERLGPGTRFPAAEDNDLGMRLLMLGHPISYAPDAIVFHRAWRPSGDYLPLRWNYGRGQGGFYAKHLSKNDSYTLTRLRSDVSGYLRRTVGFLRTQRRKAFGDFLFSMGLLAGVSEWLIRYRLGHGSPAGLSAAPSPTCSASSWRPHSDSR